MDLEPYCSRCSRLRPVFHGNSRYPPPQPTLPYPSGIPAKYCSGCGQICSYQQPVLQPEVTPSPNLQNNREAPGSNVQHLQQSPSTDIIPIADNLIDPRLGNAGQLLIPSSFYIYPELKSRAELKATGAIPHIHIGPQAVTSNPAMGNQQPFSRFRAFESAVNAARAGPKVLTVPPKPRRPAVARTSILRVPTPSRQPQLPVLGQATTFSHPSITSLAPAPSAQHILPSPTNITSTSPLALPARRFSITLLHRLLNWSDVETYKEDRERIRRLIGSELWAPDTDLLDVVSEEPFIPWWTIQLHQKVLKKTGLWARFDEGFLHKHSHATPGPGMFISLDFRRICGTDS